MTNKKSEKPQGVASAFSFLAEVRHELSQVIWPTREQTLKLTLVVVSVSILIAAYIGLLDLGFTKLVDNFIIR